jgi:Ca-activated chloride channel homolog
MLLSLLLALAPPARANGALEPTRPAAAPFTLAEHRVDVLLNNGYARTAVTQRFHNGSDDALEAVYRLPLPREASLSEMLVQTPNGLIRGEVVEVARAQRTYVEARDRGQDAALATKDEHRAFEFAVANVPAHADAVVRFVYYQPLEVDTGVGRWLYPLEPGGAEQGASFWTNTAPASDLVLSVEVKSAAPVQDLRMPNWQDRATIDRLGPGHLRVKATVPATADDLVLYYRLDDDLPGRIEVVPYKPTAEAPGTFMVVVTPGDDLAPLEKGVDYVFLVDTSGSMSHVLSSVGDAVTRSLGTLRPQDRFRVVTFAARPTERVAWTPASPEAIAQAAAAVRGLGAGGGTNLYAGLELALGAAPDRATSLVLITDADANEGHLDPARFHDLLVERDIRLFGFMMGNGGNWPLMDVLTDASGGFAAGVSNADDVLGQIVLARSKMAHAAMHDARLTVHASGVHDVTDGSLGKVFRGEQLVLFGRYDRGGPATVALDARISGVPRTFSTTVDLPDVATDDPELERLWALRTIRDAELARDRGARGAGATADLVRRLGTEYQLVTDETAMVALSDAAFAAAGIGRTNQTRTAVEHEAQDRKSGQAPVDHRADAAAPAFHEPAASLSRPITTPAPSKALRPEPSPRPASRSRGGGGLGGGAIDPVSGGIALSLGAAAAVRRLRRRARR